VSTPAPEQSARRPPRETLGCLTVWFASVVGLALFSRWQAIDSRRARCRLDGTPINPVYRVDLVADDRILASFCCMKCATQWPEVPGGAFWQVRDEVNGDVLDAAAAYFVEGPPATVPSRQASTHSFRRLSDALDHTGRHGGTLIPSPFLPSNNRSSTHGNE
jgi:hypothetical protein